MESPTKALFDKIIIFGYAAGGVARNGPAAQVRYKEASDSIAVELAAVDLRIAALEAEVERLKERDFESDHQRKHLESVGLWEEFPFGCDAIGHVADALIASRAEVAELKAKPALRPMAEAPRDGTWILARLDENGPHGVKGGECGKVIVKGTAKEPGGWSSWMRTSLGYTAEFFTDADFAGWEAL